MSFTVATERGNRTTQCLLYVQSVNQVLKNRAKLSGSSLTFNGEPHGFPFCFTEYFSLLETEEVRVNAKDTTILRSRLFHDAWPKEVAHGIVGLNLTGSGYMARTRIRPVHTLHEKARIIRIPLNRTDCISVAKLQVVVQLPFASSDMHQYSSV
jgi:hypothetical protein